MEHHQYRYAYHHHYNLYSILRLPCYTSNEEEIGKAFLKQSQLYHPNNNQISHSDDPRSVAWFQSIEYAYDVLKDSKSRAEYDQFLASSTQYEFNRSISQAPARQHSYFSWIAPSWDRKPETSSNCDSSTKTTDAEASDDSLMSHIQALESEISTLKATNSKIWAQASFHLARTDCLLRDKANLQKQLETNQYAFHRRERGYVNRIRSLESTVASLRRNLQEHGKECNEERSAEGPTLTVNLNSQPFEKSNTKLVIGNASKTPISSNLTQMPAGEPPSQKLVAGTVVLAPRGDEQTSKHTLKRLPSLMDKENLDDACKINVKRSIPPSDEFSNTRLPDAKRQKRRALELVAGRDTNCI